MNLNALCDLCIEMLEWWSRCTPFSYGEINVLLFIIIQPLLIVFYFATTLSDLLFSEKKKVRTNLWIASIAVFVLILICTFLLVFLPEPNITAARKA